MFKKAILLLFLIIFITGSVLSADAGQAPNMKELMELLINTSSPAERAVLMGKNKELIKPVLIETFLLKASLLFKREKTEESLSLNTIAVELSEFIRDKNLYGEALCQRGNILHNLKRDAEASDAAEKAFQTLAAEKNEKELAGVYSLIGDISFSSAVSAERESNYRTEEDSLNKALEHYRKALELYIKFNDKKGAGWAYSHTGDIYYLFGNYFERQKKYERSKESYGKTLENYLSYLKILAGLNNPKEEARACNMIGVACKKLGRFDEALKYYEQCLDLSRRNNLKESIADSLNNIGNIHFISGRYDETIKYYEESIKARFEINDEEGAADTFLNLGRSYRELGKYEEALKNFEQALNIFEKTKRKASA
ncbi:MAG: tetratricopeptide repeat protein, partial [Firmicutes bacterium]|nr:tetratricopeptide repeat protein [Bacillota bacterium]